MGKKSRRTKASKKSVDVEPEPGRRRPVTKLDSIGIGAYAPDISNFGAKPSQDSVDHFWKWFASNDETLSLLDDVGSGGNNFVGYASERIARELDKVNPGLVHEIDREKESIKQLIVSAGGNKRLFNCVLSIIEAAPAHLEGWQFTAFRSRLDDPHDEMAIVYDEKKNHHGVVRYSGQEWAYPKSDIRYALTMDDRVDKIGVMLFMKDFDDFDALPKSKREYYSAIGYLMLDSVLGEYDVEMHVGAVEFKSQEDMLFHQAQTLPLNTLTFNFDGRLEDKIGPKPEGGWSALANFGFSLDIVGDANKKSPTSVGGFDASLDKDDTPTPLTDATRRGVVGVPPEDPRADFFRGLCSGLVTDEGLSQMDRIVNSGLMDWTGIEEHGIDWEKLFPIGKLVEISGLESRTDLNSEVARVISHVYDTLRIGVKIETTCEELAIKPLNLKRY